MDEDIKYIRDALDKLDDKVDDKFDKLDDELDKFDDCFESVRKDILGLSESISDIEGKVDVINNTTKQWKMVFLYPLITAIISGVMFYLLTNFSNILVVLQNSPY